MLNYHLKLITLLFEHVIRVTCLFEHYYFVGLFVCGINKIKMYMF